jgi:hypothetical protein
MLIQPSAGLQWDETHQQLLIAGETHEGVELDGSTLELPIELVEPFSISELRDLLLDIRKSRREVELKLNVFAPERLEGRRSGALGRLYDQWTVGLFLNSHGDVPLEITLEVRLFDEAEANSVQTAIEVATNGTTFTLVDFAMPERFGDNENYVAITLQFEAGSRIAELANVTRFLAYSLVVSVGHGPSGVMYGLESGADIFIVGLRETAWLEVKRAPYGIFDSEGKRKFAIDVAALANNPEGGLLIIGAATESDAHGVDVIVAADGCRPGSIALDRYQQILESAIYPRIEGLKTLARTTDTGGVLSIFYVPTQSLQNKPFIVESGNAVIIAQRNSTGNVFWSAAEVHTRIRREP